MIAASLLIISVVNAIWYYQNNRYRDEMAAWAATVLKQAADYRACTSAPPTTAPALPKFD
jgi:hypothetical protein